MFSSGIVRNLVIIAVLGSQNAYYLLLRRWSLGVRHDQWSIASVLFVSELLKCVFSAVMIAHERAEKMAEKMPLPQSTQALPAEEEEEEEELQGLTVTASQNPGAVAATADSVRSVFSLDPLGPDSLPATLIAVLCRGRPMLLVALLYFFVNMCGVGASQYLDAMTLSLFMQMKLVATVFCSVVYLGKQFSGRQWRSVVLITCGVMTICLQVQKAQEVAKTEDVEVGNGMATRVSTLKVDWRSGSLVERFFLTNGDKPIPLVLDVEISKARPEKFLDPKSLSSESSRGSSARGGSFFAGAGFLYGILLASADVMGSAAASAYLEKQFKGGGSSTATQSQATAKANADTSACAANASNLSSADARADLPASVPPPPAPESVWNKNLQLAFFTMPMCAVTLVGQGNVNPFAHWNLRALNVAITSAMGGILVALTLRYSDAVIKTLAMSTSVILSTLVGYCLLDGPFSAEIGLAIVVVLVAVVNYQFP